MVEMTVVNFQCKVDNVVETQLSVYSLANDGELHVSASSLPLI